MEIYPGAMEAQLFCRRSSHRAVKAHPLAKEGKQWRIILEPRRLILEQWILTPEPRKLTLEPKTLMLDLMRHHKAAKAHPGAKKTLEAQRLTVKTRGLS
jgi:hypothetical protein